MHNTDGNSSKALKSTQSFMYSRVSVAITCFFVMAACISKPDINIPGHIASLENLIVIPVEADPLHDIDLHRVAVYSDTENVLIGQLGMSAVDENGRVYLIDTAQNVIHVYEPNGNYLTKIGGEGDGPGEFRQIREVKTEGDQLHVLDLSNMRISTFDLNNLQFEGDITIPFEFDFSGGYSSFPQSFYIQDSEHFIIHFGVSLSPGETNGDEPTVIGRLMNRESAELSDSKIYEFPAGEVLIRREGSNMYMMVVDYKRQPKIFFTGQHLIYGWTEDLLFKVYNRDGSYSHAIYYPENKIILNRNDVVRNYSDRDEPWRSMVRNDVMPEYWPAFSNALADGDGRIWASLFDENNEIWNWRVLTQKGELFAAFEWPRDKQIIEISNGYIYTRETNDETGLMEIVKYKIELQ
jgi:hypothetical protein